MSKILVAAESLAAKNSGIGRVARLMARVLSERQQDHRWFRAVSLSDGKDELSLGYTTKACHGSRVKYVSSIQRYGLLSDRIFYDSLGMGRAHGVGPARFRPMAVWMHGVEVWEGARSDYLKVASRSDMLLTNSDYTRRRAAALHPGLDHAHSCWLGTETDEMAPEMARPADAPPTALILGRIDIDSYKGHYALIDSWPEVQHRVPGARLLIAGSGVGLPAVRRAAAMSPAAPFIELAGYVAEDDLPRLWVKADVFAMPSRGEGFGLTYIEAMRYGLPVIASRQDAGQEINVDGETGFNADLERPAELVEALVALLGDNRRAKEMGAAGLARWQRHFTFSAFRARFEKLIDQFDDRSVAAVQRRA